jgi:hypothetical protein
VFGQIAVDDCQNMGTILLRIESIAHCLTRCRIYEKLYLDPQINTHIIDAAGILEDTLTKLYASILTYLARANRLFTENTAGGTTAASFNLFGKCIDAHLLISS